MKKDKKGRRPLSTIAALASSGLALGFPGGAFAMSKPDHQGHHEGTPT